ncbi:hypothetical protein IFM89_005764 [Coptis chinensis]|uniref:Uncharacterized protein n=1 Tax=Coptis chinensis TaxID=261450 RepID=A0A835M4T9_9MAGN|nr:hypothetical protein IFM89_005764 [Coptis chinensis]
MKMGVIVPKITLLFFLVLLSVLLSTSLAGRKWRVMENSFMDLTATEKEMQSKFFYHGETSEVHERLLRINTRDYGEYDSAPTLVKPPFKLIPN